jgi:hypothetical protein
LTHLNWGASYLVHDFYRRFIKPDGEEKHYVLMGRLITVLLFFLSSALVFFLDSAKDAFDIILQVGAGTGLLYLVSWFWWRINAWCEVAAMISSFLVSVILQYTAYSGSTKLLITIATTTMCWLLAAFFAPATDQQTLIDFYRKVGPAGPGWETIRKAAGMERTEAGKSESLPLALVGWAAGCTTIWSSLFIVGNFLYGRTSAAFMLLFVFLVSGATLIAVINKLWSNPKLA